LPGYSRSNGKAVKTAEPASLFHFELVLKGHAPKGMTGS
jgi:hypothetical protein